MKTARITLLVEFDKEAPTGAFFNVPALDGERADAMDIVPTPSYGRLSIIYDARIKSVTVDILEGVTA